MEERQQAEEHEHGVCGRGSLQALISAPLDLLITSTMKIKQRLSYQLLCLWFPETQRLRVGCDRAACRRGKWDKPTSKPKTFSSNTSQYIP